MTDRDKPQDLQVPSPAAGGELQRLEPTKLDAWRNTLGKATSGAALLDRIISPHDAAVLVPRLSVDDLFGYIRRIGIDDAECVLALASGTQVQGLLDSDGWSRDSLEISRIDPWLSALMRAGPDVLGPRIHDLDDTMVTHLLRSSVEVLIIEDPEDFDAPDVEHTVTPDGRMCVCFPESATRDLPIKIYLDWLVRNHPIYCMNLLVFSTAALESTLVEDAYRWRSSRMADRGYVDYYDALTFYVPATKQQITEVKAQHAPDGPVVQRWLVPITKGSERLEAALAAVDGDALEAVQSSLAFAMNMALSADRVEIWDEEHQAEILQRVRAGLILGMETINGPDASPETDASTLETVPVSLLFRIGYGRIVDAAGAARSTATVRNLRGEAGRVDGIDIDALRPWAEWLTARHPSMPDGETPSTTAQLDEMTKNAQRLADLARVAGPDRPTNVGVAQFLVTQFACALLGIETNGPLPADQLVNAHAALIQDEDVPPDIRDAANLWWLERGGQQRETVHLLLDEVVAQLGGISMAELDARHLPLLWIAQDT